MQTLEPAYVYRARVVKIVDGDTLDVDVDLGFTITSRQRLRLLDVDTPERGRPGYAEAAARLAHLTPVGSLVIVQSYRVPTTFGRYLATVIADGVNVAAQLRAEGLGGDYVPGNR